MNAIARRQPSSSRSADRTKSKSPNRPRNDSARPRSPPPPNPRLPQIPTVSGNNSHAASHSSRPRLHRSPHSEPVIMKDGTIKEPLKKLPPPLILPRDSITEDPFFRQYDNPRSARLAKDLRKQLARTVLDDRPKNPSVPPDPQDFERSEQPRPRARSGNNPRANPSPSSSSHVRAASEFSLSSKSEFPIGDLSFLAYSIQAREASQAFQADHRSSAFGGAGLGTNGPSRPPVAVNTGARCDAGDAATVQSPTSKNLKASQRRGSEVSDDSDGSVNAMLTVDDSADRAEMTFDGLVDRLVSDCSSRAAITFQASFLALYRLFASPSRLIGAIVSRYLAVAENTAPSPYSETILEIPLTVVDNWLNAYPGDFAASVTRDRLQSFLTLPVHLDTHEGLLEQIQMGLRLVGEDDDTCWAVCDQGMERPATSTTAYSVSTLGESIGTKAMGSAPSTPESSFGPGMSPIKRVPTRPSTAVAATQADWDDSLIFRSNSTVALTAIGPNLRSRANANNIVGSASRQAALLTPQPRMQFTKAQWRSFMAQPDEAIAHELTRIDWIIFSSIRLRDLIRHVTVPKLEQCRYGALVNVERAVEHFNHLAGWVVNVILLRDKPKHRVQALEKLMRVARHLRNLNNYNSLGALLAGIHGSAVHRLSATRELLSVEAQRDFMKLEILMGTAKSSAAYRLAWENTNGERIPFLPMVRKDLMTVFAANRTFAGPKPTDSWQEDARPINWTKFQIMGDILLSVQRAQQEPYAGFAANDAVRSLLMDHAIVKDDDELYARSIQLEPIGQAAAGVDVLGLGRRRLTSWLNRTA